MNLIFSDLNINMIGTELKKKFYGNVQFFLQASQVWVWIDEGFFCLWTECRPKQSQTNYANLDLAYNFYSESCNRHTSTFSVAGII